MLHLTQEDVEAAVDYAEMVDVLGETYRSQAAGSVIAGHRSNLITDSGYIRMMGAALPDLGIMGFKVFHRVGDQVRYLVQLIDMADGEPLVSMDADLLTVVRTASTAALAARTLLTPDVERSVGIIGSGAEASLQLEALVAVLPFSRATVFSPNVDRREQFAERYDPRFEFDVRAAASPEEALAGAELVVVATNTRGAGSALEGEWVDPGPLEHISSIGSTLPAQRELEVDVWPLAQAVVVDSPDVLTESGDVIAAREHGTFDESIVVELDDVLVDESEVERLRGQVTLYKSIGSAIQDVAAAYSVYRSAKAAGLGVDVPDVRSVKNMR